MREGPICRCPECRKGDIHQLDTGLYTCTSCQKTWTLEEFYPLLWFDQLMKLVKHRRRQSHRELKEPSLESIEKHIVFTCNKIKELEVLINELEYALKEAECDPEAVHVEDLERMLEMKQRRLVISRKSLQKLYRERDELTNHKTS